MLTGCFSGRLAEAGYFSYRAIGLIDCGAGVGERSGVGIGDRNSAERLTPDHARTFVFGPIRIEEGIVFVRVAVRPATDGDRLDFVRRIEAARRENAAQQAADVALESRKLHTVKLHASGDLLIASGGACAARKPLQMQNARVVRAGRIFVITHAHRIVHLDCCEEASRTLNSSYPEFFEWA